MILKVNYGSLTYQYTTLTSTFPAFDVILADCRSVRTWIKKHHHKARPCFPNPPQTYRRVQKRMREIGKDCNNARGISSCFLKTEWVLTASKTLMMLHSQRKSHSLTVTDVQVNRALPAAKTHNRQPGAYFPAISNTLCWLKKQCLSQRPMHRYP